MAFPRTLKLILLSIRDLIASAGPIVFIVIGLLIAAYWWLQPQPPKHVTLATGPTGSAYAQFGKRYAEALRHNGIEVELKPTSGSTENLQLLRTGGADVGFVRGGSADPVADEEAGLTSLGSLFYEPIWLFYRTESAQKIDRKTATLTSLAQLRGLRVNVDLPGSGLPDIMERMLKANRLGPDDLLLSNLEQASAAEALEAGILDAIVLSSAPQSPQVQRLLRSGDVKLMDFGQADAYSRRFPFLSPVTLPRGMIELSKDMPPQDVSLLAATTSLLSRDETHPALRQLFAQAAQSVHSSAGWFNRTRDFPNTRTSELPVSPEGDRAINGTPPIWQRYLPFWASNLVERMWLVLGGLLVLMLPLSRVVPPLYQFRVRRRVFRWYARLRDIEAKVDTETLAKEDERKSLLEDLDQLDRVVNKVAVPLSYADELYALRNNIYAVRKRVLAKAPQAGVAGAATAAANDAV
ncbi:TAXI family TRAP transporter solute-binding subunit [Variovorax sp. NFACC27]|uniref:C4-dicarboxylate ABC transporter substrate-binding protein n=1 Tax=Variovorax gossypii TaxID=1679495 RepID=A0A431TF82_9BURK|nr:MULTISPECIES: TAXI family TRAP transporter solute-binding subunit [Variovorax]SEF24803.1 TRAP transporter solute receptor, TAXI family [Variovorax sp. NFACC28]SEG30898.1 TRAP transporter solute receptor, TAXI family [Variovorax sp. NFACC29]SFC41130.1 TRAP transporter solute receptor, TAXI family [Variovorax sp. NFACC26]SFF90317.1 TRAP transporter solute receptor, TAXI family [Variovorax sp. NFACC27]RTQ31434.1 C4-dicarboxylate ABC transporter substrate-binding protein [Variovorax gossypii]